jgi:hypothetical protein
MSIRNPRRRARVAGIAAAAVVALAAAPGAHAAENVPDCNEDSATLVAQFRQIEAVQGYDRATDWWFHRTEQFFARCEVVRP